MSEAVFSKKVVVLFVLSALLIPLAVLAKDIYESGVFIALFILCQAALIYLFATQEPCATSWHALIAALAGLIFMLSMLLKGRGIEIEFLGFFLLIAYLLSAIIIFFKYTPIVSSSRKKTTRKIYDDDTDDDIKSFRKKDELDRLVDDFRIQPAPKNDFDFESIMQRQAPKEVRMPTELADEFFPGEDFDGKKEYEEDDYSVKDIIPPNPSFEEKKQTLEDDEEDYAVKFLRTKEEKKAMLSNIPRFTDYFNQEHSYKDEDERQSSASHALQVKELSEAPKLDLEQVKSDMEKLDTGMKSISEKIREISENAIQEGKEKKKKQATPVVKSNEVFSSSTGNKYHHDRKCVALRRVSKKNLVVFKDSNDARKRGLKACGLCKK